jgi:hypothetical protein
VRKFYPTIWVTDTVMSTFRKDFWGGTQSTTEICAGLHIFPTNVGATSKNYGPGVYTYIYIYIRNRNNIYVNLLAIAEAPPTQ